MKKIISVLLVIFLFTSSFSACSQQENNATAHPTVEEPVPSTVLSPEPNLNTDSTAKKLTHIDIVNFINTFANRHNSGHASDVTTKLGDSGETTYYFSYLDELVFVQITEKNGSIYQIGAYAFPSSATNSTSMNEAVINCIKLICLAILPCEPSFVADPDSAVNWHSKQFATAAETTDDSITSEYIKGNWKYSWLANSLSVAVSTTILNDIPSGNISNGSNTSNSGNTSSGGNTSNGSSSSNGGNTSNNGNTSNSGSTSNDGNTSQQSASCSHNYANATCTKPKTCTKCGATTGNTTDHVWKYTSCSTPKACSGCGQELIGSTPGHVWQKVTETVHHEEQGHYGEVQVAKKVKKYRCWLCSYAAPTYGTLDAYYSHFDSAHGDKANSSFLRERYETVEDWDYVYETQWIVDTPAYSETVIKGHKCSACGQEKQD